MAKLNARQQALKERFIADLGYWKRVWEHLLLADTDYFEAFLTLSAVPWRGGVLEPKAREFVFIAIDSATTHLYDPGLRVHLRRALEVGASVEEIVEVMEVTSTLGLHSLAVGLPVLVEELEKAGVETPHHVGGTLDAHRQSLKDRFIKTRGEWSQGWAHLLDLDPDFMAACIDFSAAPEGNGHLAPKLRELIGVAINASSTHLHEPALRRHIRDAIKAGATGREIMEVLELVAALGVHTIAVGLPSLLDEVELKKQREEAAR